jgi:hypothetical protein
VQRLENYPRARPESNPFVVVPCRAVTKLRRCFSGKCEIRNCWKCFRCAGQWDNMPR